jgi:hypothetical protein
MIRICKILSVILLLCFSSLIYAQEWYALSRHKECIVLSKILERKESLAGLSTPSEIEEKLKILGIDYAIEPVIKNQKGILKLHVPSKGLYMVLVQKQFCEKIVDR